MNFPQFQVPYAGHGMIIGFNAVIHVILSHGLAIGVFFFIALLELIGMRRANKHYDHFAEFAIKPTAITISSVSAITGVGIWFTIGTLAPRATSEMLRLFFWPWFIESFVFVLEAAILVTYYMSWPHMKTPQRKALHNGLGFAYVFLGLVSAFLITGIIGFQLTPGDWIRDQTFWSAFLNPSLWPQTFLRFFGGMALGGMFTIGLLYFWWRTHRHSDMVEDHRTMLRIAGGGTIFFSLVTAIFFFAYYANIPPAYRINSQFAILTSHFSQMPWIFWASVALCTLLVLMSALAGALGRRKMAFRMLIPGLIGAFALISGFERMREFDRGPYVMNSYMYTSEFTAKENSLLRRIGMSNRLFWPAVSIDHMTADQKGQMLFGHNCNTCHTIGGLNDIRDRVAGRSEDGIAAIINHTNELVPWMPPFSGSEDERRVLAAFLFRMAHEKGVRDPSHEPAPALDEESRP